MYDKKANLKAIENLWLTIKEYHRVYGRHSPLETEATLKTLLHYLQLDAMVLQNRIINENKHADVLDFEYFKKKKGKKWKQLF